jgi:hypothetical protein
LGLNISGRTPADFERVELSGGRPGLGFYQLKFEVFFRFWTANDPADALTLDITGGEVLARQPRASTWFLVGRLHREQGIPRSMGGDSVRPAFGWGLALDLAPERLEALERLRAGRDIELQVRALGYVRKPSGEVQDGDESKHVLINQSAWAKVLDDVGYRKTLLLEVSMPDPKAFEHVAEAAVRLGEARDEFQRGQYRRTVESCRQALEALGHELGDGAGTRADLRAMCDRSESLSKAERLMIMRRAAFVMACLAAHSKDEVSIRTTWDRHDALGILTYTAGLVHWIAEMRLAERA